MITNKQILCQLSPDTGSGFFPPNTAPCEVLFFDIETTGLSARKSNVFLIGIIRFSAEKNTAERIQFLSENSQTEEEQALLTAFSAYLEGKKYLVHFNGTSFDVPYLIKRYEAHNLRHPFNSITQIDLYRELMKMPAFFRQMSSHNQKSFEILVQYPREDLLSGKEMIKIYHNYENTNDASLEKLLLLHNANDLEGMLCLLPLGGLKQFSEGNFTVCSTEEITERTYEGALARELLFTLKMDVQIPARLSAASSFCYITVQNSTAKIKIPLYEGTLKYFYPDYKNYYYLPFEDEAVHKSVAVYVDSSRRQKASAANCYKKITGSFVYAPGTPPIPLLREDYSSKAQYALWPFEDSSEPVLEAYLLEILKTAITEK